MLPGIHPIVLSNSELLRDLKLGDLATWLATLGAFVAAGFAGAAYDREVKRDKAAEQEKAREEAALVAAWPDKSGTGHAAFWLQNAGNTPVWSLGVFVYVYSVEGGATPRPWAHYDVGVTPPLRQPRRFFTKEDRVVPLDGNPTEVGFVYAIEFRDSAGEYWHRDRRGFLSQGRFPDDPVRGAFVERRFATNPGFGLPETLTSDTLTEVPPRTQRTDDPASKPRSILACSLIVNWWRTAVRRIRSGAR